MTKISNLGDVQRNLESSTSAINWADDKGLWSSRLNLILSNGLVGLVELAPN